MQWATTKARVIMVAAVAVVILLAVSVLSLATGPFPIAAHAVWGDVLSHLGLGTSHLDPLQHAVVWSLRAPRLVLGLIAGATLSVAGGAYQGVFRNPLADPYLLGVAAGAGLGATIALVNLNNGQGTPAWTPPCAFAGALGAVAVTWLVAGRGRHQGTSTLVLGGVAVSSLLTSAQTFLQSSGHVQIARVYFWLLGSLANKSWGDVVMVLPYAVVSVVICLVAGRALDAMSVGDLEVRTLGLPVARVRTVIVVAASLGTAAVISAVGLIGFVGLIVPHLVRLVVGTSYRRILPVSLLMGASFLAVADKVAATVVSNAELPLGVVTALLGAPVFVALLRWRRVVSV